MESSSVVWRERIASEDYASNAYHTSRYEFAASYVAGKRVMDVACGVGYGSHLLCARGAQAVVGMDLSLSALRQSPPADKIYEGCAKFVQANATTIPLLTASFDVVVSLETIEHVDDANACLSEFRRVLRDAGLLILSTPNALLTQPINGKPRNPFHIREYEPSELLHLLSLHFGKVELRGQRVRSGGLLEGPSRRWLRRMLDRFPLSWRKKLPRLLPARLGERLVVQVTGHPMTPTAGDLEFSTADIGTSPVLVAICVKC